MQYGFLIDQRRCIGCHACTVACKAENDVPLGNFRTWVKYEESGRFPDNRRHFTVLRCNHCSNAPCVTICPVNALKKTDTGIVDLDRDACIGCRACMQACPYDALHLNEDRGCVEKCHYCAHRVERNLEPACVLVCPEQAIVSGDLDDPDSRLAKLVVSLETEVRRPEQRTGPNVHYAGHQQHALEPGSARRPATYLWSDRPDTKPDAWPRQIETIPDLTTVLDVGHKIEWGTGVALYLVTKGIAAGVGLLAPFGAALGLSGFGAEYAPELIALVFLGLTTFLLVHDLTRPELFLTLLTRGNKQSWLVLGAYLLIGFGLTVSSSLAARLAGLDGLADQLRWVSAALALGVAGYTAFLFQQCEGRDLWQSRLVLPHLLVQALLQGAVCLRPFAEQRAPLATIVILAGLVHLVLALLEWKRPHETDNARQAAAFLGTLRCGDTRPFPLGLLLILIMLPLAGFSSAGGLGLALLGLFLYEWAFIRAGQLPPLS